MREDYQVVNCIGVDRTSDVAGSQLRLNSETSRSVSQIAIGRR